MIAVVWIVVLAAIAFVGIRYQLDFYKGRRYKRGDVIHDDPEDDVE